MWQGARIRSVCELDCYELAHRHPLLLTKKTQKFLEIQTTLVTEVNRTRFITLMMTIVKIVG